ncbi:MAG: phytoene dehydrogenase [Candidatus Parcubacteria bacterium]|nr:MAG: phytoene dehydrogenase [Candidatus Parcubacteria bacterium]
MEKKRAIIIGSGVGGLSAGALLAKKGFEVLIFEKNQNFGGRVNFFNGNGHLFDMGPSWILMEDIFEDFFKLFNKNFYKDLNIIKLDPSFKIVFDDKTSVAIYSGLDINRETFENLEKGSFKKIKEYINLQEKIYKIIKNEYIFNDINSLFGLVNPKFFSIFLKTNPLTSAHNKLRKIFKNEKILKILEFDFLFLGTDPKKAPSVYGIINYFLFKQGVFYPLGGIYKIVESLLQILKENNAKLFNNTPVKKILVKDNEVKGVLLENGETILADYVISNADLFHTQINLLEEKYRDYDENYFKKLELAPSGFILYVGLKEKLDQFIHHNFYFSKDWDLNFKQIFNYNNLPDDPSFYICSASKSDPTVSPKNKDQLFILVPISSGQYLNKKSISIFKEKIYKTIEDKFEVKDIKDLIEFERIYTPFDFIRDYNAHEGTALGVIHNLKQTIFRPKIKSRKVKNLYYVGQYTYPGIGVPMVLVSGQIVYKKILNIRKGGPILKI